MSARLRPDCYPRDNVVDLSEFRDSQADDISQLTINSDPDGVLETKITCIDEFRNRLKANSSPDDNPPPPCAVALAA